MGYSSSITAWALNSGARTVSRSYEPDECAAEPAWAAELVEMLLFGDEPPW